MILSTSKIFNFLILLLLLSSCAKFAHGPIVSKEKEVNNLQEKLDSKNLVDLEDDQFGPLNLGEKDLLTNTSPSESSKNFEPNNLEKNVFSLKPETLGNGFFEDKTSDYGLSGILATHLYAVDFNFDGHTDLVTIPDYYSKPEWFEFDPNQKKFIKLQYNPLPEVVRASFLVFHDFDKDGKLDLFVGTLNQKSAMRAVPPRIFLNVGENSEARFFELKEVFKSADSLSGLSLLDYNLDGLIDLFMPHWFSSDGKLIPRPDQLWRAENLSALGLEFSNQSSFLIDEHRFIKSEQKYINATPSFGSSLCDVDRNGKIDILTTSSNGYENKMWLYLKDKIGESEFDSFFNYGEVSGYAYDNNGNKLLRDGGNSFFSLCLDYNNDSIPDVLIGSLNKESDPDTKDKSSFLTGAVKNFPPKFIRSEFYEESADDKYRQGDRRGVILDYNNDGLNDILVDNAGFPPYSRLIFFEQQKDHEYINQSRKFGIDLVNPSGTVAIDLNQDGKMDFITGQTKLRAGKFMSEDTRVYVFENKTQNKNKSLRIYLMPKESNAQAIGASIEVVTNKRKLWRIVEYSNGSLPSQNENGIHFGLGTDMVKEINVIWPVLKNGKQVVTKSKLNIHSNFQKIQIFESGSIELIK